MQEESKVFCLRVAWEKDFTDGRKEFFIDKSQSGRHSIITNNLSLNGSEDNSSVSGICEVLGTVTVQCNVGVHFDSTLPLD